MHEKLKTFRLLLLFVLQRTVTKLILALLFQSQAMNERELRGKEARKKLWLARVQRLVKST